MLFLSCRTGLHFYLDTKTKQKSFRSVLNMIAVRFNRKYKYSSSNIQTPQRGEMLVARGGMKWNPGLMSEANKRRNRSVQQGGNVVCAAIMCRVSMLFLSCRTGFTLCLDTKSKQKNQGWKSFDKIPTCRSSHAVQLAVVPPSQTALLTSATAKDQHSSSKPNLFRPVLNMIVVLIWFGIKLSFVLYSNTPAGWNVGSPGWNAMELRVNERSE